MNESKNPASRGPTSTQPASGLSAPSGVRGETSYAGSSAGRPGIAGSSSGYSGTAGGQTSSGYSSSGSPSGRPGSTPESLRSEHSHAGTHTPTYGGPGAGYDGPSQESYTGRSHASHDGYGMRSQESIGGQLRGLAHDLTTLFSKEVSLAKAEMREAARGMKAGMASMAIGGGLAFSGLLVLLFSAVYGLATVMSLWLSALIVGAVALLIGYVLVKGATKKMEPAAFVPERTLHELEQDKETAKEAMK